MKALRCIGLLVVVLLSACDAAQDAPAPKPKVAAQAETPKAQAPVAAEPAAKAAAASPEPAKPAVHELKPNVAVVPVTAKTEAADSSSKTAVKPAARSTAEGKREAAKKQSVAASKKVVKETSLSNAKLDLSLPPELARELKPAAANKPSSRKPILPQMFGTKENSADPSQFQLNGRLLSNEMQLQMRNDNRRDVEGAALDFKFKQ